MPAKRADRKWAGRALDPCQPLLELPRLPRLSATPWPPAAPWDPFKPGGQKPQCQLQMTARPGAASQPAMRGQLMSLIAPLCANSRPSGTPA